MHPRFHLSALFVAASLALAGCGDRSEPVAAASAVPADPFLVPVDEAMAARLKVAAIGTEPFSEMLRVAGRIDFDRERYARIGASVTGRVTDLDVTLGQAVKAGQVLARLHSAELGTAQLAYLKAQAQTELQSSNRDRARQLFEADVIGRAELQKRENEHAVAAAELRAAHDQLRVQGMSAAAIQRLARDGEIASYSSVLAPRNGTVVEFKVSPGQVVQAADALFTVADLTHVWAVAEVPEQQADLVAAGQTVAIEVPALGNYQVAGELIFVGQVVNPATRTVLVRSAVDNADGRLKPAMLATMLIASRPSTQLVVPASAVVRSGDADLVYVEAGERQFRAVRVTLGQGYNGKRSVLSGLKAGDRVVTDGAFHLNSLRTGIDTE